MANAWNNSTVISHNVKLIIESFQVLDGTDRAKLFLLFLLSLVNSLIQTLGIVSIMPFIAVLSEPDLVDTQEYILAIKDWLGINSYGSLLVVLGVFTFFSLLISHLFMILVAWVGSRFFNTKEFHLTRDLLKLYLSKNADAFAQDRKPDKLKAILSDVERVFIGTQEAVIETISDVLTILVVFTLLLYMDTTVTLATTGVLIAAYGLIFVALAKRINALGDEYSRLESSIFSATNHALDLYREIKISGHEGKFIGDFARPAEKLAKHAVRYELLTMLPQQLIEILAFGLLVIVSTYFAVFSPPSAANIIATLSVFAFAAYRLVPLLNSVSDNVEEILYNAPVLEGLIRIYQSPKSETSPVAASEINPTRLELADELQFKKVSYGYLPAQPDVLSQLDLQIKRGRFVCLSGPSGAGKSTTLDILLGLITPDDGKMLVDGKELTQENMRAWQNNIGYVPQEIQFLNASVNENIAFGVPLEKIDLTRVKACAQIAAIEQLVEEQLENGYETQLGDGGIALSGGEKQRIAIARAIYHDPQVLILDEATNELDAETERQVLDRLRSLEDKTIIFVSHKQSVLEASDQIIQINKLRFDP